MKKIYIFSLISAVVGAAAGAGICWSIAKKKYDHKLAVEIDSVRASYARYIRERKTPPDYTQHCQEMIDEIKEDAVEPETDSIENMNDVSYVDYTRYYSSENSDTPQISREDETIEVSSENDSGNRPYVISEEDYYDYIDNEDVTPIEIYLFDDGFLTDEDYEPIEDPNKIITQEALRVFLASEEQDEMFTRVDSRNCIYCIEKQGLTWEETLKRHPIILETDY